MEERKEKVLKKLHDRNSQRKLSKRGSRSEIDLDATKTAYLNATTPAKAKEESEDCNDENEDPSSTAPSNDVDEVLKHFNALSSFCNSLLKSNMLEHDITFDEAKCANSQKLNDILRSHKLQNLNSPTTEGYSVWAQRRYLHEYKKLAKDLYNASDIEKSVALALQRESITVLPDTKMFSDVRKQQEINQLLAAFHPLWLHLGMELVLKAHINVSTDHGFKANIVRVCESRLFVSANCLGKSATQSRHRLNLLNEDTAKKLHDEFIRKMLTFFSFVVYAKRANMHPKAPGLFIRSSKFKNMQEIITEFVRICLSTSYSAIQRSLGKYSIDLTYEQPFYDYYEFRVTSPKDLSDGIILGRLVEIILNLPHNSVLNNLRSPSGDLLRKKSNIRAVFNVLAQHGKDCADIPVDSIVFCETIQIIDLLWRLLGVHVEKTKICARPATQKMLDEFDSFWNKEGNRTRQNIGPMLQTVWNTCTNNSVPLNAFEGTDSFDKIVDAGRHVLDLHIDLSIEDDRLLCLFARQFVARAAEMETAENAKVREVSRSPSVCSSASLDDISGVTYSINQNLSNTRREMSQMFGDTINEFLDNTVNNSTLHTNKQDKTGDETLRTENQHIEHEFSDRVSEIASDIAHAKLSEREEAAACEAPDKDLYAIDVDEMAEKIDMDQAAEDARRSASVPLEYNISQLEEEEKQIECEEEHNSKGLSVEIAEIDGETVVGWRESDSNVDAEEENEPYYDDNVFENSEKSLHEINVEEDFKETELITDDFVLDNVPMFYDFNTLSDTEVTVVESQTTHISVNKEAQQEPDVCSRNDEIQDIKRRIEALHKKQKLVRAELLAKIGGAPKQ